MRRGNTLYPQLIYSLCLILFFVGMLTVVQRVASETSRWESLYAFQLAGLIEGLHQGDVVRLDVTSIVTRARKAGVEDVLHNVIRFSGTEVGVQLAPGSWHWYAWYTPIIVEGAALVPEGDRTILTFQVVGR